MEVGVLPRVPMSQGVMSAADGPVRSREAAGASPATLTISGRQADRSWLHLSRKQDRHPPRSERYRRLPPFPPSPMTASPQPLRERKTMFNPVRRSQSQLLPRRSYKL